ncbi:MAG TPA: DNA polymerase I, partial [bacterium]|nr:DNA polymerase I [bacterium]
LKLPAQKKIKTGYSTNNEVLLSLENMHPIVPGILRHRSLAKFKTSFLDVIAGFLSKEDMIHPVYNQTVTATGRLSSSGPNIQNIPVRGAEAREIRKIFIPLRREDFIFRADYSQIELRILAHLSGDKKMVEIFKEGGDIHEAAAREIFSRPEGAITKDERRAAKTINFGIVYGMSPYGLARALKISNPEAAGYIDRFFFTFPGVKAYQEETKKAALQNGFVSTMAGRRRYISNIDSRNRTIREFAERAAINAPIQGTAADIIKEAMINIDAALEKNGMNSKMILQVHDELVFSAVKSEGAVLRAMVTELMEAPARLRVPVTVTTGEGENWYECG